MAFRTGANTPIVIANSGTFGTAKSITAGGLTFVDNIAMNRNFNMSRSNAIGSGKLMDGIDTQVTNKSPTVTITKDVHYGDAGNRMIAQFFGGGTATQLVAGAFAHSHTFNETFNSFYNTIAMSRLTDNVEEAVSTAIRKLTISAEGYGPVKMFVDGLANDIVDSGSAVNTYGGLDSATCASTTRVIFKDSDSFMINAQAGDALDSGDILNITGFEVTYDKPQEHVFEATGTAGNTAPRASGDPVFKVTLKVNLRRLNDFTYRTAVAAGTAYKAALEITGGYITGTTPYVFKAHFPYLKLLTDIDFAVGSAGENAGSLTFEGLMAAANPTGMIDEYPYILSASARATSWLDED